jgi:hypothetical protein
MLASVDRRMLQLIEDAIPNWTVRLKSCQYVMTLGWYYQLLAVLKHLGYCCTIIDMRPFNLIVRS